MKRNRKSRRIFWQNLEDGGSRLTREVVGIKKISKRRECLEVQHSKCLTFSFLDNSSFGLCKLTPCEQTISH